MTSNVTSTGSKSAARSRSGARSFFASTRRVPLRERELPWGALHRAPPDLDDTGPPQPLIRGLQRYASERMGAALWDAGLSAGTEAVHVARERGLL